MRYDSGKPYDDFLSRYDQPDPPKPKPIKKGRIMASNALPYKLDELVSLAEDAAGVQAMFITNNTGENAVILGAGSAHDVVVRTNNAERLRIRADFPLTRRPGSRQSPAP